MKATVFTALEALGAEEAQLADVVKIKASKQMNLCRVNLSWLESPREKPAYASSAGPLCLLNDKRLIFFKQASIKVVRSRVSLADDMSGRN